jgi:uncharacterized protein
VSELLTTAALSLFLVSFGVGIVVGLTGMGGGALMTPALIFLGIPPTTAVANDLVAASVNKSVGATVHWREGSPNLKLAFWLIIASVPTAFAGAFIIQALGASHEQESFVKFAIGVALLFTASTYALRMYIQLRHVTGGNTMAYTYRRCARWSARWRHISRFWLPDHGGPVAALPDPFCGEARWH